MNDSSVPPAPVAAALLGAFPCLTPANLNDRYDERLNGYPVAAPWRDVHPLPVLHPDVRLLDGTLAEA